MKGIQLKTKGFFLKTHIQKWTNFHRGEMSDRSKACLLTRSGSTKKGEIKEKKRKKKEITHYGLRWLDCRWHIPHPTHHKRPFLFYL